MNSSQQYITQPALYLDIDGVLLGKKNGRPTLAKGASEFLKFVTLHFNCHWLTTHCQGDATTAVNHLKPYVGSGLRKTLALIKPTRFNVLKTEALPKEGLFYWLDDQPLAAELHFLEEHLLHRVHLIDDLFPQRLVHDQP